MQTNPSPPDPWIRGVGELPAETAQQRVEAEESTEPLPIGRMFVVGSRAFGIRALGFVGIAVLQIGVTTLVVWGLARLREWLVDTNTRSTAFGTGPDELTVYQVTSIAAFSAILLMTVWILAKRSELALDGVAGRRYGNVSSTRNLLPFLGWTCVVLAPVTVLLLVQASVGVGAVWYLANLTRAIANPVGLFMTEFPALVGGSAKAIADSPEWPTVLSVVWIAVLGFGPLAVVDGKGNPFGLDLSLLLRSWPHYLIAVGIAAVGVWSVFQLWGFATPGGTGLSLAAVEPFGPARLVELGEWGTFAITAVALVFIQLLYDFALCLLAAVYRSGVPATAGVVSETESLELPIPEDPLEVTAQLVGGDPTFGHRDGYAPVPEPGEPTQAPAPYPQSPAPPAPEPTPPPTQEEAWPPPPPPVPPAPPSPPNPSEPGQ